MKGLTFGAAIDRVVHEGAIASRAAWATPKGEIVRVVKFIGQVHTFGGGFLWLGGPRRVDAGMMWGPASADLCAHDWFVVGVEGGAGGVNRPDDDYDPAGEAAIDHRVERGVFEVNFEVAAVA